MTTYNLAWQFPRGALSVSTQNEQGHNGNDECNYDARSEVEGVQDREPGPIETDRLGVAVSVHQRSYRRGSQRIRPLMG